MYLPSTFWRRDRARCSSMSRKHGPGYGHLAALVVDFFRFSAESGHDLCVLASCPSRASPRGFGARCVLICHKSVRFAGHGFYPLARVGRPCKHRLSVSNSALIFANACSSNSCFSLNVASNLASEEDVLTEGCLEAAFGVEVRASYMLWGVCLLYAAGRRCGLGTRTRCSRPPRWVNRCTGLCSFSAPTSIVRFVY